MGIGCGWCPHGRWCQWSIKKSNMAFGYYASLFPSQNIKVKSVTVTFLSHNSDFYYWNCEFTSCNSDFIGIVRYCKFTVFKVTITHYPLYSMAEISFHKFHMCKGKKQTNKQTNKQTKIKMHSLTHILTPLPYLFSLFLIQLFLSLSHTPCLFLQLRLESAISKYFSDLKNAYQLL